MTKFITKCSLWGCLAVICFYGCGDSTTIGSDIFSEDEIGVEFVDTISIRAKTISLDSIPARSIELLIGSLDDPIFGRTRAEIVGKIDINSLSDVPIDNISRLTIDSLVMILALDANRNYGDSLQNRISLEVFQVDQALSTDDILFTNRVVNTFEDPIGSVNNYLLNFDSIAVFNPLLDTIETVFPQIRVAMEDEFLNWWQQEILNTDTPIEDVFNGFKIGTSETKGFMTSVNLAFNEGTRFRMYYTQNDSTRIYDYLIDTPTFNLLETDNEGTDVGAAIDDLAIGNNMLYLQPLQGTQIELDLSGLKVLEGNIINEVNLQMTVAEQNVGNLDYFAPIPNLRASIFDEDGVLIDVEDFPSQSGLGTIEAFFGGNLEDNDALGVMEYNLNITQFVRNRLIDGEFKPLFIEGYFSGLSNRSVIFGPRHGLYPMKLNITYTLPR